MSAGPDAAQTAAALEPLYGHLAQKRGMNALDELIFTVLTQNTSDLNAERAYESLRSALPRWEQVEQASDQQVADLIRHGGLANIKSVRIKAILAEVRRRAGRLDLDWLADEGLDAARSWMLALPGVGIKTASVVASFALGLPALPVDTHIHRVSRRLGLVGARVGAEEAHHVLEAQVAPQDRFRFHMLLISHGRALCRARRPRCGECPLRRECPASEAQ